MSCLLLIDDDTEFCEVMADYLKPEGFQVQSVHDGRKGLQRALAETEEYDLIILDVMLPGMNGFEVLRCIRARQDTPVLMVTSYYERTTHIAGLEMGADDYLAKPFAPRELIARIRAILRRTKGGPEKETALPSPGSIAIGDIELDTGARIVRRNGEQLEMTSVEFDFLEMLLREAGRVVTREHLAESILGRALRAYDRSVDVHVSSLRKKLGHKFEGIERIRTVRGVGYSYAHPLHSVATPLLISYRSLPR